jgi:hypothetical protein
MRKTLCGILTQTHMKTFLVLISIFAIFSCSTKKQTDKEVYYIIKKSSKLQVDTVDIPAPPPPPLIYYGQHNFILTDSTHVFYHDYHVFFSCGNGVDFSKPPRLFLAPDSLTEIKINELQTFLRSNIPDTLENGRWISANISSSSDTIFNIAFKIITDYFKSKNIKRYGIRNWTEEENFATTAKLNKTPYDPMTADFQTGFDVKFIPPMDSTRK